MTNEPDISNYKLYNQYKYFVNYFCIWNQSRAQEMTIIAVVICIFCMALYIGLLAQTYIRERKMKEIQTEYDVETYGIFGIY